jgi:hypothetical protein
METEAFTGSLSYLNVGQLLRLLQTVQATGRLELVRAKERTDVFVEEGRTLFARTTGASLRVGDVLVRRGAAPPEAIELVLAVQRDQPGARIGRMLVESGVLTESEIHEAVLAVQRAIVLGLLTWREGRFRFFPEERIEGEDIRLDLDLDRLLTGVLTLVEGAGKRRGNRKAA